MKLARSTANTDRTAFSSHHVNERLTSLAFDASYHTTSMQSSTASYWQTRSYLSAI